MKRSGIADLPLHGRRVPAWLATRMTTLGTAMGMDWISDPARFAFAHGGKDGILSPCR